MIADHDVLIATTYVFCTIVFAEVLRSIFDEQLGRSNESLPSKCIQEFISSIELCAVCYEIGFVMDVQGPVMYSLYSFITGAWLTLNWGDRASVDPFKLIIDLMVGEQGLLYVASVIGAQLLGCSVFYQFYLKHLWSLGFGKEHVKKFDALAKGCSSEVKGTVMEACLAESGSLMIIILAAKAFERSGIEPISSAFLNSFVTVCFEMSIMQISGGFLSPIIASGFEFACVQNVMDHLIIFWIGPFIAAVFAYLIWNKTGFSNLF